MFLNVHRNTAKANCDIDLHHRGGSQVHTCIQRNETYAFTCLIVVANFALNSLTLWQGTPERMWEQGEVMKSME